MGVQWHGPYELLKPETQDMTRAINSLMEELEAVDWYNQRADLCHDQELRAILEHNRDEEKEHASMLMEWIRRRDSTFDGDMKTYLFGSGSITGVEAAAEGRAGASGGESAGETEASGPSAFTVGSLRGRTD